MTIRRFAYSFSLYPFHCPQYPLIYLYTFLRILNVVIFFSSHLPQNKTMVGLWSDHNQCRVQYYQILPNSIKCGQFCTAKRHHKILHIERDAIDSHYQAFIPMMFSLKRFTLVSFSVSLSVSLK